MTIRFWCPNAACKRPLSAKDEFAGRGGHCPICGTAFTVPSESTRPPSYYASQRPAVAQSAAQAPPQPGMAPPSLEVPGAVPAATSPQPAAQPQPQVPPAAQMPPVPQAPQQQGAQVPPQPVAQLPQQQIPQPPIPQMPQQQMAQAAQQQMAPMYQGQQPVPGMVQPPPRVAQMPQAPQQPMMPPLAGLQPTTEKPTSVLSLVLALVGAGILVLGILLLPVKTAPGLIFGKSWSYFEVAWPEATVVLLCAAGAIVLALVKWYRLLLIPGVASLVAIILTIVMRGKASGGGIAAFKPPAGSGGQPVRGLEDLGRAFSNALEQVDLAAMKAANLAWTGLIVLMVAAVVIIVAGVLPTKKATPGAMAAPLAGYR